MTPALRLLCDPPDSGAWNMAVDEVLLETAATTGLGTLRLYQWSPATLSLGYFQAAADRQQHGASGGCPLVRRTSGGGAILHDRELTYSVALPAAPKALSAAALYDAFHETLVAVLNDFGVRVSLFRSPAGNCEATQINALRQNDAEPFLCFQRRSCGDVVCGDWKIAGSAQRRRRGAILQHGSILLARSAFAPELPGIADLTGKTLAIGSLTDAWTPSLAGRLAVALVPGPLTPQERSRAQALLQARFGDRAFTLQR